MDFRDLLPERDDGRVVWTGVVAATATDFTTLVPVTLPDYDPTLQWGPCRWQSRDAVSLPRQGDECLVVFDNKNEPWIIAWWPF